MFIIFESEIFFTLMIFLNKGIYHNDIKNKSMKPWIEKYTVTI